MRIFCHRVLLVLSLLGLPLLAAGCASSAAGRRPTAHRCPDHQALRCLTQVQCSYDEGRGCEVCQCAPPDVGPAQAPPDQPRPVQPR
ncbi:MAG: hypothetical protein IT371_05300 [Deltaproteobacteria bacterium]|nr:hypothetical protein [Deltaproteobacteria bacterium]